MKKICYFVNALWYFELHWMERARSSVSAGYDVYVFANFSDFPTETLEKEGIKCINSNINEKGMNPVVFMADLLRAFKKLNKINPDIIHCITIKPGVMGMLWSYVNNKKLVYSFVGLGRIFDSERWIFKCIKNVISCLYGFAFKKIDYRIIFEHKSDRDKIIEIINVNKINTVVIDGAGINLEEFKYTLETRSELKKVLFAGRMLWSKGLKDLIYARKILRQQGVDFEIDVAGIIVNDDGDAIPLEQIVHWAQAGEINWLGYESDINAILRRINIVALPSRYPEGIPRILLEAGAVGRTCVVYDSGGCSSLIIDGYNGYVAHKGNINELAQKIGLLITDELSREKMGKNARENIEKKYDSEIVIRETLDVYRTFFCAFEK